MLTTRHQEEPVREEAFYHQGPYTDEQDWVISWLEKDLAWALQEDSGATERNKSELQLLLNLARTHRFRPLEQEFCRSFVLRHNDLHNGQLNNVLLGPLNGYESHRITGVIDWEGAAFVPYWYAIFDIFDQSPYRTDELAELVRTRQYGPGIPEDAYPMLSQWETSMINPLRPIDTGQSSIYDELTTEDFMHGDRLRNEYGLSDQDRYFTYWDDDSQLRFWCENNNPHPAGYTGETWKWLQPEVWKLMEPYILKYMDLNRLCKWRDPFSAYCLARAGEMDDGVDGWGWRDEPPQILDDDGQLVSEGRDGNDEVNRWRGGDEGG